MNQQVVKRNHVVYSLYYLKTESPENFTGYMIRALSFYTAFVRSIFGSHKYSVSFARDCSRDAGLHVVIMSNFKEKCKLLKKS